MARSDFGMTSEWLTMARNGLRMAEWLNGRECLANGSEWIGNGLKIDWNGSGMAANE
jgi:hypothetical protein